MRHQALRQAAALKRQAGTLAEWGAAGPRGFISEVMTTASTECQATVRSWQPWATARPAAAAAPQPWACLGLQRGLASWAAQQGAGRELPCLPHLAAAPPGHAVQRRQQQQQRRAASAQAELAPDESGGGGGDALALSDAAVGRLKELQAQSAGPVTLRVTVEGGGCSGFQYEFSIEEGGGAPQPGDADRLFERDGVRLVCDDISLEFLKGSTVDFESDLMRSAFVVQNNPNAASSCGCGSSFVAK